MFSRNMLYLKDAQTKYIYCQLLSKNNENFL